MMIRSMNIGDVDTLAKIELSCFSDPWSVAAFTYELTNPLSTWLVAEQDGNIVGYVGSQAVLDEADVMNVAVIPQYRRQGIAKLLIQSLIEQLQSKGVQKLSLEVRVSNEPAIALYNMLGFEQVGRRPGYYRKPREDALIMRKEWI